MNPAVGRWAEISVRAESEAADDLAALFRQHCRGGAVIEEIPASLPSQGSGPGGQVTVRGFLPAEDERTRRKLEIALLLLAQNSAISQLSVRVMAPEDWSESWKAYFPPQHIGERLVIVPTWHEYDPLPEELVIRLDPGMAFGTGLHATTRLCLRSLERLLRPGMRVLDVGTGSGILSIAAALLGAAEVQALDIDPLAVDVARGNFELNGCTVARAELGALGDDSRGTAPFQGGGYDLLLVNILARVIIRLAAALPGALAGDGVCVASGILVEQCEGVADALTAHGLAVEERLVEENWAALVARKP